MAPEGGPAAGNSPCFLQAQKARTYGQDEQELAEGQCAEVSEGALIVCYSEERGQ